MFVTSALSTYAYSPPDQMVDGFLTASVGAPVPSRGAESQTEPEPQTPVFAKDGTDAMDVFGGKLLTNTLTAGQKAGSGMMAGEVAPVGQVARFDAARQHASTAHLSMTGQMQGAQPVRVAMDASSIAAGAPVRLAQLQPAKPTLQTQAATSPAATPSATTTAVPTTTAQATPATTAADAKDRARRALDLAPVKESTPSAATGDGDRILDGLTRLRGVFDNQIGRLNGAMGQSVNDTESMIGLQVEVINFSMLVDVASKLTGKTTGALETLMKGQ